MAWTILIGGCAPSGTSEQRWFAREIERDLDTDVHPQAVLIDSIASRAVSGLEFRRGMLFDRMQIDAEYYAVNAAVLGDEREVLRTAVDLSDFLRDAGRLSSAVPGALCGEAVAFAGPRSNNRPIPQVYHGQAPFREFVESLGGFMEPALDSISFRGLEMRSNDVETVVRMWVAEPDQITEYLCTVTDDAIEIQELRFFIGGGFRVSG